MTGFDPEGAQDGAVETLGGREVRGGDADVVEHPAEASVEELVEGLGVPRIQRTGRTTSIPRLETRCARSSVSRSTWSLPCCSKRSTSTISAIST